MERLICLDSVSLWESKQTAEYPEIKVFIEKLKKIIREKPEKGLADPILSYKGQTLPCRKHAVNITLFSRQYAIGYNFLEALYLHNNKDGIVIVKMNYK